MNHYETLFIVKPTLTDEEIKSQVQNNLDIITKEGGEIVAVDDMGMRKLAYPVEKNERGYYTVIYYKAPGALIAELERQMRYNEDILKFMTIRYSNKKEIAQFEKLASKAGNKKVADQEPTKESAAEEKTQEAEPATEE